MKRTHFKGGVEEAYGETLPEKVEFEGYFDELESLSEANEDEKLEDADILKVLNAKRKAAARAKATKAKLDALGITAPEKDSPITLWRNMFATLRTAFKSDDRARKVTTDTLGYNEAEAKTRDQKLRAEKKAREEAEAAKETVSA